MGRRRRGHCHIVHFREHAEELPPIIVAFKLMTYERLNRAGGERQSRRYLGRLEMRGHHVHVVFERVVDLVAAPPGVNRAGTHVEQYTLGTVDRSCKLLRKFMRRTYAFVIPYVDAVLAKPGHFGIDDLGVFMRIAHEDIWPIARICRKGEHLEELSTFRAERQSDGIPVPTA